MIEKLCQYLLNLCAALKRYNPFLSPPKPTTGQKKGIGLVEMGCKELSCLTFRTFWLILHKIILVF
jgi:hypothetical protein